MAVDRLWGELRQRQLLGKLTLRMETPEAIVDPKKTFGQCSIGPLNVLLTWVNVTISLLWIYPVWVMRSRI